MRDRVVVLVPDAVILIAAWAIAGWWGVAFGLVCALVARWGTVALTVNALAVLVAMVAAILLQGPLQQGFAFVAERPIANELGLLLIVAVLALVIPRPIRPD